MVEEATKTASFKAPNFSKVFINSIMDAVKPHLDKYPWLNWGNIKLVLFVLAVIAINYLLLWIYTNFIR
jgi:hypothetical protein